MREEETSEDGGELVTVVRRWFFPPVQEKQFVVTSSSRKHQPLFPLNQQCKNGVRVWVKTRKREGERERREFELWWGDTRLHSPTPSAPLLLAFLGGHTELSALSLNFNPPCTCSLGTLALSLLSPKPCLMGSVPWEMLVSCKDQQRRGCVSILLPLPRRWSQGTDGQPGAMTGIAWHWGGHLGPRAYNAECARCEMKVLEAPFYSAPGYL